ncbi:glycine cleavage system protein GcvH [Subtercola boreus]|uniref:Glycine cleavage system H protein n=1 Tax=Subtercola boreus TaxID=120213 RepID=A0A3E0W921_9MICO|nr:glycine cleavage system protein GcvH [Subtercola boreus]RFA19999.1 glycine cleavage system protein H [Subtercola boreus]RFA20128.1 glycine cleavage system protein H [Subtercola boreus]RFA26455.1 glycine cleavage system protein H [Subtercola boreus]
MTDFDQLRFTAEHEWVRLAPADAEAGTAPSATIGITAYAADKLGDVVFVDLPDAGVEIADGAVVGEIESTKSVGELFAPVNGTVLEKNAAVEDAPELVNSDPYGEGWLIRVEYTELPELLNYADYQALLGDEAESVQ